MIPKRVLTNSRVLDHRPYPAGPCVWLLSWAALLVGCAPTNPPRLKLHAEVQRPPRTVMLFVVDGFDYQRMDAAMQRGELPNLRKRFREEGVEVGVAVTSLPPLTYPNSVSLLTGRFPGHHGVIGNQWLNRDTLVHRNYITQSTYLSVNQDFECPTLFEALPGRFTVDVHQPVCRGSTNFIDNQIEVGPAWFAGLFECIDQRAAGSLSDVGRLANKAKEWPSLIVQYFPGIDEIGHRFGSDSSRYAGAMRNIDAQIGRVLTAVDQAGLSGSTYAILVSDHGHMTTSPRRILHLVEWLEKRTQMRIHEGEVRGWSLSMRERALRNYSAVAVDGSARRMVIYLKSGADWKTSPTPPQAFAVLSQLMKDGRLDAPEGLALACSLDPAAGVRVISRLGSARVERRSSERQLQYRMIVDGWNDGSAGDAMDPLGYGASEALRNFIDAGWHESREWLEATHAQAYPDFVPQVVELFDSRRGGDLVFFADRDWVFHGAQPGEHGAALAGDMQIPMFFAGPELAKGAKIECGRIVDVMPTILEIIAGADGAAKIGPLDGVSLWSQLRAAGRS